MNLEKILKFNNLLTSFREIERQIFVKNIDQNENDAEHSFQLALLGWYIADSSDKGLNKDLIIKYALAHDLVEVYAGDTDVFSLDKSAHESKQEREARALERIKEEFPEFKELHGIIQSYEDKIDNESKFIYALDKLLPVLNIYQDSGRTWKKRGISFEMIVEAKKKKIETSPEITEYFEELVKLLEDGKTKLFA